MLSTLTKLMKSKTVRFKCLARLLIYKNMRHVSRAKFVQVYEKKKSRTDVPGFVLRQKLQVYKQTLQL